MADQVQHRLVDVTAGLEQYPIGREDRLDAHSFIKWWHHRWKSSRTFKLASWEAQGMARALFDMSWDESPVGTLPDDDAELAVMLRTDARRVAELRRVEFGPFRGWRHRPGLAGRRHRAGGGGRGGEGGMIHRPAPLIFAPNGRTVTGLVAKGQAGFGSPSVRRRTHEPRAQVAAFPMVRRGGRASALPLPTGGLPTCRCLATRLEAGVRRHPERRKPVMHGTLSHIQLSAAPQDDAFLAAWERWYLARAVWRFEAQYSPSGNFNEPSCLAAERHWHAAMADLLSLRPVGAVGIAAAAHVLWEEGIKELGGCSDLDSKLQFHLLLAIWQAASGRDGRPPDVAAHFLTGEDR